MSSQCKYVNMRQIKEAQVENSEETPRMCFRVYRAGDKGTKYVMSCSLLACSLLPHSLL